MKQISLNNNFYKTLFEQQQQSDVIPSNKEITGWDERLICVLYPQLSTCVLRSEEAIKQVLDELT